MRKKEFAARVWSKLIAYERHMGFFKPGDRVLAAVSGGPDSVCLAHFLAQRQRQKRFTLRLLHIHHGLRGRESDRDASFVVELAKSLGVAAEQVRVKVKERAARRGKGLEDAGRELRYQALLETARRHRCGKVAIGHQLDDQAETVLLHLLRGTKLQALGGIAPRRPLSGGIELVRPLLPLTRKEILEYLRQHRLSYRTDRSNGDPRFLRNWIRAEVITLLEKRNPRIREHLSGVAEQVRSASLRRRTADGGRGVRLRP